MKTLKIIVGFIALAILVNLCTPKEPTAPQNDTNETNQAAAEAPPNPMTEQPNTSVAVAELEKYSPSGSVLASWKEYDRETPKRIFFIKKGSKLFLTFVYARSSLSPNEMAILSMPVTAHKEEGVTILSQKGESSNGETYIIDANGNLSMHSGIDGRQFGTGMRELPNMP